MATENFEHWLAELIGQSESEIRQLLDSKTAVQFLIAWSLFEHRCFTKSTNVNDREIQSFSERIVASKSFDIASIREHAWYFHTRYQDNIKYSNLIFEKRNSSTEVVRILKLSSVEMTPKQIINLSAFVAYRFRNNIFHGNKGISSWLKFNEQIDRCTLILQKFISHGENIHPTLKPTEGA